MSFSTLPQLPLPVTFWNATSLGSGEPQPQTGAAVLDVELKVLDELDELELLDELDELELLDEVEVLEVLELEMLELLVVLVDVVVVCEELVVEVVEVLVVVVGIGGSQVESSAVQPPAGQFFARYRLVLSFTLPVGQTRQ